MKLMWPFLAKMILLNLCIAYDLFLWSKLVLQLVLTIYGPSCTLLELIFPWLNLLLDGVDEAQFIKSRNGHAQLVDKAGYVYNKHQSSQSGKGKKVWWKCVESKKKQFRDCKARATTEGFYITQYTNVHTHPVPELVKKTTSRGKLCQYMSTKYT